MKNSIRLTVINLLLVASNLSAATHYVSLESTNPTPPYTNWATAATNFQDAVNRATANDVVVVTNGVYPGGVTVTNPLMLLSVNGPQFTVINGGGTNQCISLTDGASITGFTLTNGVGGVYCESNAVLTNCVLSGNSAWAGGGAYGGTLYNCTLSGNSATGDDGDGGGAAYCTLYNCMLSGNSATGWNSYSGGAYSCTLYNCTLRGNSVLWRDGGGACLSTLYNCTLTGNAGSGGGAVGCTLYNCTLSANAHYGANLGTLYNCTLSGNSGDGADGCTLYNCTLSGNSGRGAGGCTLYSCALSANAGYGAYGGTQYNCTITGNSGGGVSGAALYNCITYFNTASGGTNYDASSTLNYCCTTPLPTNGVGNISADPQLASASHLSAESPCIGAGSAAYATGTDIDGDAWNNPPSIGCDEYHRGAVTGPLTVSLAANYTSVAVGFPVQFTAFIAGRTTESVWDFGDGDVAINQPYTAHAWAAPGDYTVALWAFNESNLQGVSATGIVQVAVQPVVYVAAGSANPQPPYLSWSTAATNIQAALDGAGPGALVLVTNGTYPGGLNITTPLAVRSINGPQFTLINGGGANQCVSSGNGASLTGFTLTNGLDNIGNGGGVSGSSTNTFLTNCIIVGNSASEGGGASSCTLYNCMLIGNSAPGGDGGGAAYCTLYNCMLSGNSTGWPGFGGGAAYCTLYNCTLTGNAGWGGGACLSTLYNCTLSGNSSTYGGGALSCTLYNCIVYFNTASADANYDSSCTLTNCCTTPLPTNGVGNISANPQLASAIYLSADSPCIGAGSATYATSTDIDGQPWANPPSIGCAEYRAGTETGPLTVGIQANYTNVAVGYPLGLTGLIGGRPTDSVWDFGDGDIARNEPYITHTWTQPGQYHVALWAFNESNPDGVSASVTIHAVAQPVVYVSLTSTNPQPPYATWATAATNIQDAVDVPVLGGIVMVTNGVYPGGVTVTNPVRVISVNGPEVTVIDGDGTNTCVSLLDGASLTGFTLTNGLNGVSSSDANAYLTNCAISGNSTGWPSSGGGASSCTLYNCMLIGNSAWEGGGAYSCTLYNCTLAGNSVPGSWGGGAAYCTLYNCTLSGNSAPRDEYGNPGDGGGAYASTLYNCIVYFNTASRDANYDSSCTLTNCCTTPLPTNGVGNISANPDFVHTIGWSNLRLQANSPCINAGNNAYVATATDLDGNPRIVGGTVDMGAYEYQTPVSQISYAWLQQYGLPITTNIDSSDLDGAGFTVYQDWMAGLNPTNALSVLRLVSAVPQGTNAAVTWQSVAGINYFLECSTNLAASPCFSCVATNLIGQLGTTTYLHTNATGPGPFFYRVGVNPP